VSGYGHHNCKYSPCEEQRTLHRSALSVEAHHRLPSIYCSWRVGSAMPDARWAEKGPREMMKRDIPLVPGFEFTGSMR
jgi:hypothetical protein